MRLALIGEEPREKPYRQQLLPRDGMWQPKVKHGSLALPNRMAAPLTGLLSMHISKKILLLPSDPLPCLCLFLWEQGYRVWAPQARALVEWYRMRLCTHR